LGLESVSVFGAKNGVKTVVGPGVKAAVSGAPDASLSSLHSSIVPLTTPLSPSLLDMAAARVS
jgi:hypothetical protein